MSFNSEVPEETMAESTQMDGAAPPVLQSSTKLNDNSTDQGYNDVASDIKEGSGDQTLTFKNELPVEANAESMPMDNVSSPELLPYFRSHSLPNDIDKINSGHFDFSMPQRESNQNKTESQLANESRIGAWQRSILSERGPRPKQMLTPARMGIPRGRPESLSVNADDVSARPKLEERVPRTLIRSGTSHTPYEGSAYMTAGPGHDDPVSLVWDGEKHVPVPLDLDTLRQLLGDFKNQTKSQVMPQPVVRSDFTAGAEWEFQKPDGSASRSVGNSGIKTFPYSYGGDKEANQKPRVGKGSLYANAIDASSLPANIKREQRRGKFGRSHVDSDESSDSRGDERRCGSTQHGRGTRRYKLTAPKTLSYDGTGKWKSFLTKFTSFADASNWSRDERRRYLGWYLEGKASDFYSNILERYPNIGMQCLLEKFAQRFDFRDLPENLILEFQRAKQEPNESLPEWGQRIVDLAYEAFRLMDDDHIDKMAVKRFCQGSLDKDAAMFAANASPSTIEEAIDKIKNFQHNRQQIYGMQKSRRAEERFDVRCVDSPNNRSIIRNQDTDSPRTQGESQNLNGRISSLEKKVDLVLDVLQKLTVQKDHSVAQ